MRQIGRNVRFALLALSLALGVLLLLRSQPSHTRRPPDQVVSPGELRLPEGPSLHGLVEDLAAPPPGGPRRRIAGVVRTTASNPIKGAHVYAAPPGRLLVPASAILAETRSGDSGEFTLDVPVDLAADVLAHSQGLVSSALPIAAGHEPVSRVVLELDPGAAVSGHVILPDGTPAAGVKVSVAGPDVIPEILDGRLLQGAAGLSAVFAEGETAEDGSFRLAGLRPGTRYHLQARKRGLVMNIEFRNGMAVVAPSDNLVLQMDPAFEVWLRAIDATTGSLIPSIGYEYEGKVNNFPSWLADEDQWLMPTSASTADGSLRLRFTASGAESGVQVLVKALGYESGSMRLGLARVGSTDEPRVIVLHRQRNVSAFADLNLQVIGIDRAPYHGPLPVRVRWVDVPERSVSFTLGVRNGLATVRHIPVGRVSLESAETGRASHADGRLVSRLMDLQEGLNDLSIALEMDSGSARLIVSPVTEDGSRLPYTYITIQSKGRSGEASWMLFRRADDALFGPLDRHALMLPPGEYRILGERVGYQDAEVMAIGSAGLTREVRVIMRRLAP